MCVRGVKAILGAWTYSDGWFFVCAEWEERQRRSLCMWATSVINEMTTATACYLLFNFLFCPIVLSSLSFFNNSATPIDAEMSCAKITVIKRELQAKRSLLCLEEHTRVHKHSNIQISPYARTDSNVEAAWIQQACVTASLYSERQRFLKQVRMFGCFDSSCVPFHYKDLDLCLFSGEVQLFYITSVIIIIIIPP